MKKAKDGKPTINDVARIAGVSKKTVSRVINRSPLLNEATREKVEAVIAELGYVPNPQARALALRRNFLIGLIHDNPNAQMVLGVQQGILSAITNTEFALVVRPVNRRSPDMLDDVRSFLEQQRLYGVLLLPPISENDALADLCEELGVAWVRMGSVKLDEDQHMVASNDREAVAKAVAYLIGRGHRRIGFVAGPEGFRSAAERALGFTDALASAGLAQDAAIMAEGSYTFETGIAAGEKLLAATPRPTAIFASNDEMAAGVLHAARKQGLSVPEDLSIVGFDDTAIAAHIWPPLTTVRWPIKAMAKSAALKLIDPAEARRQPSHFLSDLIERASVRSA
ncbi:MAG: LacI family transcriptional regulator [Novosphingobium sp. 28-62-57]|uniref:LacI family DNA-binding transcriptional regulator n=1 Tax=unclassified Novosphingobium TaxID=2644732 RepID=UPI000BC5BAC9|nr:MULTISPECIES: LacI family DNA-binding transcriptional regulator [unclassified Novosphingobium]OYW51376.1 MAG: LacI family transcriptional regulator [Novosphingobium sp. 12-62-10]OYZ10488.1 MAG: LacI family transcriptional regulator [Novosphingobium sp. 28-62-57]OZA40631.1 MAG: LacI family transcriptional regulator [Novosphingobium sp. 17-62-9]HQS68114.1 LacI family DNA-binding transcriptional regulator [Novosphingobium sp.]